MELLINSILTKPTYDYVILPGILILSFIKKTLCPDEQQKSTELVDILDGAVLFKNGEEESIPDKYIQTVYKNDRVIDILKNAYDISLIQSVSFGIINDDGEYNIQKYKIDSNPELRV